MGNIVPGADTKVSVLGVPVPDYARPKPMQGITMNPAFVEGGTDPHLLLWDSLIEFRSWWWCFIDPVFVFLVKKQKVIQQTSTI